MLVPEGTACFVVLQDQVEPAARGLVKADVALPAVVVQVDIAIARNCFATNLFEAFQLHTATLHQVLVCQAVLRG